MIFILSILLILIIFLIFFLNFNNIIDGGARKKRKKRKKKKKKKGKKSSGISAPNIVSVSDAVNSFSVPQSADITEKITNVINEEIEKLLNTYIDNKILSIQDIFKFQTYDKMFDNICNVIFDNGINVNEIDFDKIDVDKVDVDKVNVDLFKDIINDIKCKNINNISYFDYFKMSFDYIIIKYKKNVSKEYLKILEDSINFFNNNDNKSLICDIIKNKLKEKVSFNTKFIKNYFYKNKENIIKIFNLFSKEENKITDYSKKISISNTEKYTLSEIKIFINKIYELYNKNNFSIKYIKEQYNNLVEKTKFNKIINFDQIFNNLEKMLANI